SALHSIWAILRGDQHSYTCGEDLAVGNLECFASRNRQRPIRYSCPSTNSRPDRLKPVVSDLWQIDGSTKELRIRSEQTQTAICASGTARLPPMVPQPILNNLGQKRISELFSFDYCHSLTQVPRNPNSVRGRVCSLTSETSPLHSQPGSERK